MKVLACLSAFVLVAPIASAETVLLDFTAKWCGPCRQMEPVVAGLEREGYKVTRINIDLPENRSKVQQYRVKEIPTFVVLTDGRESGRLVGAVPADSLKRLLGPAGSVQVARTSGDLPKTAPGGHRPATTAKKGERPNDQSLIDRSVRIVVDDNKSRSFGTGTVIRSVPGETLVLTCAHLFQGVSRNAKTTVEFFGRADRPRLPAEVVSRDAEADVCLIRVMSQNVFAAARVASRNCKPATGQNALSVGCDNGADPTVRHMRITAINRYLGAPTIECSGEPVEGRSGGGLFNEHGEVIGVCSARDPADKRGIYGGLAAVQSLLDRNHLTSLYQSKPAEDPSILLAGYESQPNATVNLPSAQQMGLKVDQGLSIPEGAEHSEVICVIQSLKDPQAPAKVVLLPRASPEFLSLLEKERAAQLAPASTSMRMPGETKKSPSIHDTSVPPTTGDWRKARTGTQEQEPSRGSPRAAIEESARWERNWPAGSSNANGPVRR